MIKKIIIGFFLFIVVLGLIITISVLSGLIKPGFMRKHLKIDGPRPEAVQEDEYEFYE